MKAVILGGGLAGLSAALNLPDSVEALILERDARLGGLLKTDQREGFFFDYGPHLFFHTDPYFLDVFGKAMAKTGYVERPARTGQVSFSKLIDFPYAVHLKELPPDVVTKCVTDFAHRQIELAKSPTLAIRNYEDYCRAYFGDGFTDFFMIPYAKKIWTVHPKDLDIDWVGTRIVLPDLREVIRGAIESRSLAGNYIKNFRYPKTGGTQSFVNGIQDLLGRNVGISPNSDIAEIDLARKRVTLTNGIQHEFDVAISTLPLPELAKRTVGLPRSVQDLVDRLKWFGVLLLNFPSREIVPNPYQWIYFDQGDAVFHRIHYPNKLADRMAPEGFQSIQAEISFSAFRSLPGSAENLLDRAWKELNRTGFAASGQIPDAAFSRRIDYAYAIMDHDRQAAVQGIHDYYKASGLVPCGRFGDWDYIWTDKVLLSGRRAASEANGMLA